MMLSGMGVANNTGFGAGLGFEFPCNKRKNLTCFSSLYYTQTIVYKSLSGYYSGLYGEAVRPVMIFVASGIRYYLGKKNLNGHYSIGTSVITGNGKGASNMYYNGTNTLQYRSVVGITISNTINIQFSKYFRSLIELQLGVVDDNGINAAFGPGTNGFGQLTISFGTRW